MNDFDWGCSMGEYHTLFTDIGGVLLTNGWDRHMRRRAAEKFGLDIDEVDERHHLIDVNYELGQLSLDEYLDLVVFNKPRPFSREAFQNFMFSQSVACDATIEFMKELKSAHNLRVVAVSNEGRELTQYRIEKFSLRDLIDVFICSCFVGYRKPDPAIFHAALDIVQADPANIVYIDDRSAFVEAAERIGIRSIQHTEVEATREELAAIGLTTTRATLI